MTYRGAVLLTMPEALARDPPPGQRDAGLDTLAWQRVVAAHYEQFIADPPLVAVVGPQTSLGGRAIAALLWLRENFEPIDHVAHGHLLFRVTPEALRLVAARRRTATARGQSGSPRARDGSRDTSSVAVQ